ncbi:MAG: helix-turn-helix transcriptional regulator [Pirellulales bacterium]
MTTLVASPPDASGNKLLDVQAVANLLGCSPRTVYRFADCGRMPRPVKLGALIRWSKADLDAWIAAGCPAVRNLKGGRA